MTDEEKVAVVTEILDAWTAQDWEYYDRATLLRGMGIDPEHDYAHGATGGH
jgi:hypothetical protein